MQKLQKLQTIQEKPKCELFAKLFANFEIPKEVMTAKKFFGMPLIGSKNFTKMMLFADEVKLNNDDIDYWCHIKPARQENESYEEYKMRQKFQHFLNKYRPYIYQYPEIEKKHSTKRAKKIMKKLGII